MNARAHAHAHAHAYARTNACRSTNTGTHKQTHTHTHACARARASTRASTRTRPCSRARTRACRLARTRARNTHFTCTFAHANVSTNSCRRVALQEWENMPVPAPRRRVQARGSAGQVCFKRSCSQSCRPSDTGSRVSSAVRGVHSSTSWRLCGIHQCQSACAQTIAR